jgi:uncharacterized damage-inducible protein DinB
MSPLILHFQMLARYNRVANERVFAACATIDDEAYRRVARASFGSLHRTLNHLLLADRIWMARLDGSGGASTPPLGQELCETFPELRTAREAEDVRIQAFMDGLSDEAAARDVAYVNMFGVRYVDPMTVVIAHMFNHQTHHRGQAHVLLSEAGAQPISLDLHRIIKPDPEPGS